ncbi:MAG: DUF4876 domain-containing protein [Deltaproteobacteria bacterium]|nr:DUF4876 domain-containing protein [Deltaproteobacteria bacterium]
MTPRRSAVRRGRLHPWLVVFAFFAACAAPEPEVPARPPAVGELLISQLYTSGASPAGGTDHYFSDQFVELVNATDVPLDLSGVRIADVSGAAGAINPGMTPDGFRESHPDQVVMSSVWRLPDGARLEPAEKLVIAHDGGNHRPFSDIDLSSAGFEAFVEESGGDQDHPTVANLEPVAFNGGFDWLMTVFGPSVVVLDAGSELGEEIGPFGPLPTVAVAAVLDGVDTVMDADSEAFKRLPDAVDRGFSWHDGPYTGTALHRVSRDGGWQDTDDSSIDFALGAPEPARPSGSDEVFGDPWVELGTGPSTWSPLAESDPVELVAGPQGGFHIDAAVWFGGFGPGGVVLVYEAVDTDAERVSFVTQAVLFEQNVLAADEGWYRVGDRIVLDIDDAQEVVGAELILRVTAALGDATWSDERRVVVVDED